MGWKSIHLHKLAMVDIAEKVTGARTPMEAEAA